MLRSVYNFNDAYHNKIPVNRVPTEIYMLPLSFSTAQSSKSETTTGKKSISKNELSKISGHPSIQDDTNVETNTRPGVRKYPPFNQGSAKRLATENTIKPGAYSNTGIPINCSSVVYSTDCDDRIEIDPVTEVYFEAFYPSIYRDIHDYIEKTIFANFYQTNLTISSTYYSLPLIDNSVNNMNIQSGVNFLAYCCSLEFYDRIIPVIIPKGYYTDSNGQFTLTEELWELICPKCKQPISGNNVQGIGFRQCNVRVKYRYVDGVTGEIELNVDESNFSFAKLSPPGSVRYHFVKFQIKI